MGKFSRDKGARVERNIVNLLKENHIEASRVPLSGAAGGRFAGDVDIRHLGRKYRAECKARKNGTGFATINKWKGDNDFLFLIENNREPMVYMTITEFIKLLNDADTEDTTSTSESV
tara:strand:+ start:829 stop:1179 length:351 start_codon:yes stop_codon:yes gene_type:complete